MDIIKIVSMALCTLFIIILVRKVNTDYAFFISCVISISICVFSFGILIPVFEYINELEGNSQYSKLCTVMFKSTGICLLCSLASELCRDAGQNTLATKIEFAGKCTLLTYSLPLIQTVFRYATSFID